MYDALLLVLVIVVVGGIDGVVVTLLTPSRLLLRSRAVVTPTDDGICGDVERRP